MVQIARRSVRRPRAVRVPSAAASSAIVHDSPPAVPRCARRVRRVASADAICQHLRLPFTLVGHFVNARDHPVEAVGERTEFVAAADVSARLQVSGFGAPHCAEHGIQRAIDHAAEHEQQADSDQSHRCEREARTRYAQNARRWPARRPDVPRSRLRRSCDPPMTMGANTRYSESPASRAGTRADRVTRARCGARRECLPVSRSRASCRSPLLVPAKTPPARCQTRTVRMFGREPRTRFAARCKSFSIRIARASWPMCSAKVARLQFGKLRVVLHGRRRQRGRSPATRVRR